MRSAIVVLALLQTIPCRAAWETIEARAAGMNPQKIEQMLATLRDRKTEALLIVRRGRIVHEWYAEGWNRSKPHGSASLAKALAGGLSLAVALDEGRIAPDEPASKYIPGWKNDPLKSKITIRQLATHSSGIEDAEQDGQPHMQLPGWKGAFWRREADPFSIAVRDAPVVFEPGTRYAYSNPGMAALGYAVTASLQGSTHPNLKSAIRDRIARPIGVADAEWDIGYGRAYEVDGLSLYANWGGGSFTARAAAQFGVLLMMRGELDGRRIIARQAVDRLLADAGTPVGDRKDNPQPRSSLCWWLNTDGVWEGVPRDAFAGAGAGHEFLMVVPSLDLVVVRYGQALNATGEAGGFWVPIVKYVMQPAIAAVDQREAYPRSPVIANVRFAGIDSIVRQAPDSDNWPLTWGDDDAMYTAYGDGRGFAPFTEKKLSLGFARILGTPEKLHGVNVRSQSGERTGDGAKGAKASGMLMAGKVLYMWVRNVGNAELAWSADHGATWKTAFKLDRSFGSPAFLNFGRNYEGARDRFVYAYSQDGDSAYESDNRVVLGRAPVDRIREREAWEFFAGYSTDGSPRWSRSVDERAGVFRNPRRCQRVDAVYDPGLKRYLLVVGFNHSSGWGIYDAPEPWGPWTTAFETEQWDIPGAHGYRIPAKWIDRDGRRLHLVFSASHGATDAGYDAFCVRRFEFDVR